MRAAQDPPAVDQAYDALRHRLQAPGETSDQVCLGGDDDLSGRQPAIV